MALSSNKKILIGCGIVAFIGVLAVVAVIGFLMYSASDPDYKREYAAKKAEGAEFGKNTDQDGCMKEGLTRARKMTLFQITPVLVNEVFVQACLKSSRPTPDFCNGVPGYWNLHTDEWENDQCERAGMDPLQTGCRSVFSARIDHCSGQDF